MLTRGKHHNTVAYYYYFNKFYKYLRIGLQSYRLFGYILSLLHNYITIKKLYTYKHFDINVPTRPNVKKNSDNTEQNITPRFLHARNYKRKCVGHSLPTWRRNHPTPNH